MPARRYLLLNFGLFPIFSEVTRADSRAIFSPNRFRGASNALRLKKPVDNQESEPILR